MRPKQLISAKWRSQAEVPAQNSRVWLVISSLPDAGLLRPLWEHEWRNAGAHQAEVRQALQTHCILLNDEDQLPACADQSSPGPASAWAAWRLPLSKLHRQLQCNMSHAHRVLRWKPCMMLCQVQFNYMLGSVFCWCMAKATSLWFDINKDNEVHAQRVFERHAAS